MANETKYSVPLCRLDCIGADPHDYPYLHELPVESYSITPVDVYGGLGFTSVSLQGPDSEDFCPLYAYCDGPTDDGVTSANQWDRYITRWVAVFDAGEMFYGKVGDVLIPAPSELFPDKPFENVVKISISFDANARPVFCMAYKSGVIEIRRFEAGIYTKYSFTGKTPVLIFNGILQSDLDLRDVVCYYTDGSDIYARFQRDNFATEYKIVDNSSAFTLKITDRGRDEMASVHVLDARSAANEKSLFYVVYPPWPVFYQENATSAATINSDLDYSPIVVQIDLHEYSTSSVAINSDIDYQSIVVSYTANDVASTANATINSDLNYDHVIIITSGSDSSTAQAVIGSDIHYYQSVVSFSELGDASTSNAVINSDISYIV